MTDGASEVAGPATGVITQSAVPSHRMAVQWCDLDSLGLSTPPPANLTLTLPLSPLSVPLCSSGGPEALQGALLPGRHRRGDQAVAQPGQCRRRSHALKRHSNSNSNSGGSRRCWWCCPPWLCSASPGRLCPPGPPCCTLRWPVLFVK